LHAIANIDVVAMARIRNVLGSSAGRDFMMMDSFARGLGARSKVILQGIRLTNIGRIAGHANVDLRAVGCEPKRGISTADLEFELRQLGAAATRASAR
jgi:hypothetical protein